MVQDKNSVTIRPREENLYKLWAGKNDRIPVNNQQHSFDSIEEQEKFILSMFESDDELHRYHQYRFEWYRRAKEFDPDSYPLAVCCELVSSCNLSCPMCYTYTPEFQASVIGKQRVLPWKIVKKIIDECAELKVPSMLFSWRGESTLYRSQDESGNKVTFYDILSYARKKGILEVTSLTNGQCLDDDMIRGIVDADPSWISFSIDGLESNYNKIRTPVSKKESNYNAFQKVVESIKKIIKIRNEAKKKRPQIRTNTIFPPIRENPKAYRKFMKDLGVGWVTVNEILDFRQASLPENAIIKEWACQYPFQRLTISANGSILPCTGAHNEETDLLLGRYPGADKKQIKKNGKNVTIDLHEVTLAQAWKCEQMDRLRKLHKANRRIEIETCRQCRHGAVKHGVEWIPKDWDMDAMQWKGHEWRT